MKEEHSDSKVLWLCGFFLQTTVHCTVHMAYGENFFHLLGLGVLFSVEVLYHDDQSEQVYFIFLLLSTITHNFLFLSQTCIPEYATNLQLIVISVISLVWQYD